MHLVFDIFQGIGVAAAVGIRPFLPALAVGALAAGDVQIDFKGSDYDFLQQLPFLAAMLVGAIALALAERRLTAARLERGPVTVAIALAAVVVGALLFAGSLCRGHYLTWPGYPGGVACALVGVAATRPLLTRARSRLEDSAAGVLPLFAEAAAVLLAVLSVLAPPIGPIGLALLLWLVIAGRGRGEQKFAGLRILR